MREVRDASGQVREILPYPEPDWPEKWLVWSRKGKLISKKDKVIR